MRLGVPILGNRLKTILVPIFSRLRGVPNPSIHHDVNTGRQCLNRANRAADVELGIGMTEARRLHRARQHDCLIRHREQHLCGFQYGIRSVSDDNPRCRIRLDALLQQLPVIVCEVEAILSQERFDLELDGHIGFLQHFEHLGRAHLVFAFGVEINFVNRAARGEELQLHYRALDDIFWPSGKAHLRLTGSCGKAGFQGWKRAPPRWAYKPVAALGPTC
jgi:hypothetical protein